MTKGIPNKLWFVSLSFALVSNIAATTLTLLYDNGTTYIETNTMMAREIGLIGQWVPILNACVIVTIYGFLWLFMMRRQAHPDVRAFASFVLFFFPALTSMDAFSDFTLVFGGIPLFSLQDIQLAGVLFGVLFVLSQWRVRPKRTATVLAEAAHEPPTA